MVITFLNYLVIVGFWLHLKWGIGRLIESSVTRVKFYMWGSLWNDLSRPFLEESPNINIFMSFLSDYSDSLKRYVLIFDLECRDQNPGNCVDKVDYTVHGILQARILECVTFPFSRGSSQPRDQTGVSHIASRFFTSWATREAQEYWSRWLIPSPIDLRKPGIKSGSLTLQADSLKLSNMLNPP